ncbi:MAG: Iron-sulfur cluster repair protein YtfE [Candidatus Marinimicrobia bacterium]|nr:Iron-sulfur cluster repair protein YtfE [Candidatus Neomarinimicrobiota bacterium]
MHTIDDRKLTNDLRQQTVGEIVSSDYRNAEVFKRYDIDFCCGGDIPLTQACADKDADVNAVIRDLQQVSKLETASENYDQWNLDFLADYIVNEHHGYTKQVIPQLNAFAEKVAMVHGDRHPETRDIADIWSKMSGNMITHMQREELQLFPYIKKLVQAGDGEKPVTPPAFDSASGLITELENDHDDTGNGLAKLDRLSDRFTPPQDACNTYRALYASLQEFTAKTKEHIHLENNILFPKAIQLVKSDREEVPQ